MHRLALGGCLGIAQNDLIRVLVARNFVFDRWPEEG